MCKQYPSWEGQGKAADMMLSMACPQFDQDWENKDLANFYNIL